MNRIIKIKRGLEANLPGWAHEGELLYTLDTNRLFSGNGEGNSLQQVSVDTDQSLWSFSDVEFKNLIVSEKIGVGTTTPDEALEVSGKIKSIEGFKTGNFLISYNPEGKSLNFNFDE